MFSNFSVRKPYTVIVSVILIAILGAVSLTKMSTDLLPSINFPYAVISTSYEGASPEEVETVLTKPIEQTMASVSNIKSVNSISSEDSSTVILEFTESTNMDSALIEIREGLDMVMGYMPENVGSPLILKMNPDMLPIMVLSASIEGEDISKSSKYIENNIIPELEGVEGIAYVQGRGLLENRIEAIIKDDKIKKVNEELANNSFEQNSTNNTQTNEMITKEMISGILKGQNFSMPAGYITEDDVNYLVRTGDKLKNIDDLKKLPVMSLPIDGMDPILLGDVAEISEINNSGDIYNKVNGNDSVMIIIQKQTEFNTSDVAKSINTKIEKLTEKNDNIKLVPLLDQGKYIDIVVGSISNNLIIGALLSVLILFIFLRDIKPTIVIGFAIPVSLVAAFIMMYFSGVSLNIISMGGLALGVGMLVDNSIVVIENIYRMRNEGKSATAAAINGAKQVTGAISASTLTTISVFLPILFTEGITRELFTDMGLTIAFSLISSLFIAVTLVPMISSKILKKNIKKDHKIFEWIKKHYTKILSFSLNNKILVTILTIVLFVGSTYGTFRSGTEFFPKSDTGQLNITVNMPKGTTDKEAMKSSDEMLKKISDIKDIETLGASIANSSGGGMFSGMGGSGGSNSLSVYVILKEDRTKTTPEVSQIIRDRTKDLDMEITITDSNMDLSAMSGSQVSIEIKGRDFDVLEKTSKDIAKIVSEVDGTVEIDNGVEKTEPEISVTIDKEKSVANGLTVAQVFQVLSSKLKDPIADSQLSINTKDYDIFIKNEEDQKTITRSELKELEIENTQEKKVKLSDISKLSEKEGFSSIKRSSQQRVVTVTASLEEGYNVGKVNKKLESKLENYKDSDLAEGYSVNLGGEYETTMESFKDLFMMLALAIVFIYLIMVAQFQSLISPFIVMFTIPLAFTGGLIGLIVTQNPLSVVAMIGLIVLSGVVVNNGIVFVDYVNIMRQDGMNKRDALIKAGNDRLRPILMTALTTIFALSTLSIGIGQGTEMMQPMAITAIGGLIYATLITLVLIPVLYELFNRKKFKADSE
ncbi:MAG: efflux RND transporter permease subunit [Clostridiales bacterium]